LISDVEVTNSDVRAAIRRGVVSMKFVPVFMGSAFKNRGVQLLLDGVLAYLPDPTEVENLAFMKEDETKAFPVNQVDPAQPLIAYAFKLEESKFGQLTYMRIYQGTLRKGNWIRNVMTDKKVKVPRLVRMHSEEMEDVEKLEAGDICAIFGVDCSTGTTFTDQNETKNYLMSSMHVPEPVMSLAITTKSREQANNFTKALRRFQKEDPTFRVTNDNETGEILISGMGELHLEIYVERMRREYKVDAKVGKPQVAYRETIQRKSVFEMLHKKQSGGQGQYAKLMGYLEPIADEEGMIKEFVDATIGGTVPPNLVPAVIKGYEDCLSQGPMTGFPVERVRMVITDGAWHPVDSTEIAFRTCSQMAFKEAFKTGDPSILEPIMSIELVLPNEFQGAVVGLFNRRKGVITESSTEGDIVTVSGEVPLNNMFGFSTELRSNTQGKGEFSMEYKRHDYVPRDQLQNLFEQYKDHKRSAPAQ
jgi:elongation factor G